jgi:hypothetical protein
MSNFEMQILDTARAVKILRERGCTVTRITIDGSMPLIEVDRAPISGPAMVRAIRGSSSRSPRSVYIAELCGCRIETPARQQGRVA